MDNFSQQMSMNTKTTQIKKGVNSVTRLGNNVSDYLCNSNSRKMEQKNAYLWQCTCFL